MKKIKTKEKIKLVIRKIALFLLVFLLFTSFYYCGGGFGSDTHNSNQFKNPVFGGDSLR